MKEIHTPDYVVELDYADESTSVTALIGPVYDVVVNQGIFITVTPWLPQDAWPSKRVDEDRSPTTRDEAAWFTVCAAGLVVAPGDGDEVEVQDIARTDIEVHGLTTLVVRLPPAEYRRLHEEIGQRLRRPIGASDGIRGTPSR